MSDHSTHLVQNPQQPLSEWWVLVPAVAALAAYLVAAFRQNRIGKSWNRWRTFSFVAGIFILIAAVAPPVSRSAHDDIRIHMVQHLLIGMVAPIGLVLGAPLSLLLRTVKASTGRRVARILRWRPIHLLSHPVTALIINIGGMYVLYLTPLFALSMDNQWLHHLINLHFLAAGYLFAWSIAGPDPAPDRPAFPTRVAALIVSLGLHAYLGKLMYAHLWPRNVSFSAEEIREAAIIMYYGGDIAELLLAVALFATWYRQRRRKRMTARFPAPDKRGSTVLA